MENEYVEPLCKCGNRFFEHSEPCQYWLVDVWPSRDGMWRQISWTQPEARNKSFKGNSLWIWLMPVLKDGNHEFDICLMRHLALRKDICEDMGINYRVIEE